MLCISAFFDPENEDRRHTTIPLVRVNVLKAPLAGLNGGYDDVTKTTKHLM